MCNSLKCQYGSEFWIEIEVVSLYRCFHCVVLQINVFFMLSPGTLHPGQSIDLYTCVDSAVLKTF